MKFTFFFFNDSNICIHSFKLDTFYITDKDDLHSLLEPLSKEQLISLVVNACSSYPAIAEENKYVASKDSVHWKLFVRGLAWETSLETLCDAF